MNRRTTASATWNQEAWERWVGNRREFLERVLLSRKPGWAGALVLALLDGANVHQEYEALAKAIRSRSVTSKPVSEGKLRATMTAVKEKIDEYNRRLPPGQVKWFIETAKDGKTVRVRLVPVQDGGPASAAGSDESPFISWGSQPSEQLALYDNRLDLIARALVETKLLPFHGLYQLSRAAARWLEWSTKEVRTRARYEPRAWDILGLRSQLPPTPPVLAMCDLAVGEGVSTCELLKSILADPEFERTRVDYCPVDVSQVMMDAHLDLLRASLGTHMKAGGRLRVVPVLGNVLDEDTNGPLNPAAPFERARTSMATRGVEFAPEGAPLLLNMWGNVLANRTPENEENRFLAAIRKGFTHRPLFLVLGVSLWGGGRAKRMPEKDVYDEDWYDFLLMTPRLLESLGKLEARSKGAKPESEFGSGSRLRKVLEQGRRTVPEYEAVFGLVSEIDRFTYRLRHELAAGEDKVCDAGTLLTLCSIRRYEPNSLATLLTDKGFEVLPCALTIEKMAKKGELFFGPVPIPVGTGELEGEDLPDKLASRKQEVRQLAVLCAVRKERS